MVHHLVMVALFYMKTIIMIRVIVHCSGYYVKSIRGTKNHFSMEEYEL